MTCYQLSVGPKYFSDFTELQTFVFKLAPSNTCTHSCIRHVKLKATKLNLLTLLFIFFGLYALLTIW